MSEFVLLGKRDLGPSGTLAQTGPGANRTRPKLGRAEMGRGPKWKWAGPEWAAGSEPFRGDLLGYNWSRKRNQQDHMYIPIGPQKGIEVRHLHR